MRTVIAETSDAVGTVRHAFEGAGLGSAPYRFLRAEVKVGPLSYPQADGTTLMVGAPGQPMSHCDFCQTSIANEFWFRSADGREFKVGSDCIAKSGDAGLRKAIAPAVREAGYARDDARIASAKDMLTDAVRATLAGQPHPYRFMAEKGHTALSFVEFNMLNAGRAGKIKAARLIEKAAGR